MKKQRREYNVDSRFLKEVVENLIREGNCVRVEDQKNTYRYKG